MEHLSTLSFALVIGVTHAFEADHLIAVSSLASRHSRIIPAMKEGVWWGLGHTTTIFIIGLVMIIGKSIIPSYVFSYLEALVGLMLILLGVFRLVHYFFFRSHFLPISSHTHSLGHSQAHKGTHSLLKGSKLAYGVGLIHGLAGSGTLVLLVMSEIPENLTSMLYIILFGLGSALGMMVAAGIFCIPLSRKWKLNESLHTFFLFFTSLLCIGYGLMVIWDNIF